MARAKHDKHLIYKNIEKNKEIYYSVFNNDLQCIGIFDKDEFTKKELKRAIEIKWFRKDEEDE